MNWRVSQAFYFSVQSGLSVGFGANPITCGKDQACMAFSVAHILIGSSLIAASIGVILASIMGKASDDNIRILRRGTHLQTSKSSSLWFFLHRLWVRIKEYREISCFTLWTGIGILYGMAHEKWTFIESWFFATSALSTAGMLAPDTGDTGMFFTGFYCLTGVAVYAQLLSWLADVFVLNSFRERQRAEFISQFKVSDGDFRAAALALGDNACSRQFEKQDRGHKGYIDKKSFIEVCQKLGGGAEGELCLDTTNDVKLGHIFDEYAGERPYIRLISPLWPESHDIAHGPNKVLTMDTL
eukprot:UC4_evm1s414